MLKVYISCALNLTSEILYLLLRNNYWESTQKEMTLRIVKGFVWEVSLLRLYWFPARKLFEVRTMTGHEHTHA